jgi:hypothetical protein
MMAWRNAKGPEIELGRPAFSAQKTASMMEAVQIRLLSIDRPAIMVNISVVIALFDDDGFVAVPMITVADDVAVPVTISVTLTNRYASTANTNAHLFRSSGHCAKNSSDGGDHYGILNHCVLLSLLSSARAMPRRRDRSGLGPEPAGDTLALDGVLMLYIQLTIERWSLTLSFEKVSGQY